MWLKTKVSKKRTFWAEKVLVFIIVILLYNNCFIFPLQDFFIFECHSLHFENITDIFFG